MISMFIWSALIKVLNYLLLMEKCGLKVINVIVKPRVCTRLYILQLDFGFQMIIVVVSP